jgi:hypothetical protein
LRLRWIDGVNAKIVKSNPKNGIANRQSHAATFAKVVDGRKQPVRELRRCGDRYV